MKSYKEIQEYIHVNNRAYGVLIVGFARVVAVILRDDKILDIIYSCQILSQDLYRKSEDGKLSYSNNGNCVGILLGINNLFC